VAELLVAALPHALLFDPEVVGAGLRAIVGRIDAPDDFQDIPLWRTLTVQTARLLRQSYGRDLIVPMTIARPDYFAEVTDGLRRVDADFHHFCLTARPETLCARLAARGHGPGTWPWRQVARCVAAFEDPRFARHIAVDGASPEDVAAAILDSVGRRTGRGARVR
jgi:hypothetical protein